ncbi:thioredoxin family protein [Candidatus Peregrinibacteria bacterium]|jgi:peroxiredoxin|nr:thioredoxin family protein [Candidatus Peregrinibacteria bacterium]MBT7483342.1 thioredoxin family protein [Candidatus Peregrinibacteria bacterium]MBT7703046.1 thioredoxin family protein [Candidatus Peregrinibacteria bacterium]
MAEYTLATNPFPVGSSAPDFELLGADGETYNLASFADKDVLVVAFVCNHCPYVVAYWDRLKALVAEFVEVQFVGVNSNDDVNYPDDSYEKMVELVAREGIDFPYLRDDSQAVAKAYHAERTPQVFVFSKDRKLVYTGGIDDSCRDPEQVGEQMLKDALVAMREGHEIVKPEAPSIGCSIKWKY